MLLARRATKPLGATAAGDTAPEQRSNLMLRLGTFREAMLSRGPHFEQFVYPSILTGYRLHNLTFAQSLQSLFQWHNETMNVWTHLAGFVLFMCLLVYTAMMAGGVHLRMPEPLRECAQVTERASCLRSLTLRTLSPEQATRFAGSLALKAVSAESALESLLGDLASRALDSSASGAVAVRERAANAAERLSAQVQQQLPNITIGAHLRAWLARLRSGGASSRVGEAVSPPTDRLGALVAHARRTVLTPRDLLASSPAASNTTLLLNASLERLHLGLNLTVAATARGEALLSRTADMTRLQFSALVTALPAAPELANIQKEAQAVLKHFSDRLSDSLPDVVACAPRLERWCMLRPLYALRADPAPHGNRLSRPMHNHRTRPIYFFLTSAMVCLMGSAVYHLFGTANSAWISTLGTLDFVGITALIVGSFVPILYYGFYEHGLYRNTYVSAMVVLGGVLLALSVTPMFHDERYRAMRTLLFVSLGLCGVVPITHMLFHYDFDRASTSVLSGTLLTGGAYLCGTVFYLSRFPEVVAPGRFDLVLSSHNIWHVMVVIAACVHYVFVLQLWTEKTIAQAAGGSNTYLLTHNGTYRYHG